MSGNSEKKSSPLRRSTSSTVVRLSAIAWDIRSFLGALFGILVVVVRNGEEVHMRSVSRMAISILGCACFITMSRMAVKIAEEDSVVLRLGW